MIYIYIYMNVHTNTMRQVLRCAIAVFWAKESWYKGQGGVGRTEDTTNETGFILSTSNWDL